MFHHVNWKRITLFFCFSLLFTALGHAEPPLAEHGLIDGRLVNLSTERLPLNGEWHYFQDQLLAPEAIDFKPDVFRTFPKIWNEFRNNGQGTATYAIQVMVDPGIKELALEIPPFYSSYQLWINGKLIASNGRVGTSAESSIPQWLPQTVSFIPPGDTLQVVLQVSNFQHHKGGSKDPIYLGSSELLQRHRSMAVMANLGESIVLGVLSVLFFVIYLVTVRKKVIMYFALLCLTWALRVGFSNLYVFIHYFPDFDWTLLVRIEYISLFLTMIWAILFLGRVFPKEDNKLVKYLLVGSNIIFIAYSLVVSPLAFTRWLPVYLSFCGILLVFGGLMVLRAWINERVGATFLTISVFLGILVFSYNVFAFEGFFTYNPIIFSIGYITLFSLMGIVLLLHLNIIKSKPRPSSVLTYEELFKNDDLLTK